MKKVDLEMLERFDPEIADLLKKEEERQRTVIGLIASENVASVLSTCLEGSAFSNKNTEGYPGRRFTGGCEYADAVEQLAVKRLKELFGCEHANLQSGNATIANVAVLLGLLETGDTVLSMNLNDGGHLSHGARFHISGKLFNIIHYGVSEKNELIDMDNVRRLANEYKPKMIVCGASSYPRLIDYKTFKDIAKSIGAYLWVDSAHDIGLVAAGVIPSPVPYADIVTFSTQKTLRGPRGCGVILCKKEIGSKIDRGVFPMLQGGPKADMIAARAVLFKECMADEFKKYGKQALLNAKALAKGCSDEGIRLVTGGTDTHMVLLDVTSLIPTGQEAENVLNSIGIVTNKNMIPFDQQKPFVTSGIRIGTPAVTSRNMGVGEMKKIAGWISDIIEAKLSESVIDKVKGEVRELVEAFPLYPEWRKLT